MSIVIKGNLVDENSRCIHYQTTEDIIAIKFKCCNQYYACIYCHIENEIHLPIVWQKNDCNTKAIVCGNCRTEMTIEDYLASNNKCANCNSLFNPKCSNHYHFYFE